ncbi:alanine racemase [Saccharibacter sp. 17.LH.SD]|uniref:alanine racemase n=1 Tax=Saccharibacter sp. 17.LH.SD TaxID=2689393 RepID=UPI00136CC40F|nr:alanine racemase [Saccharibacter sp. 17.LH.SD]
MKIQQQQRHHARLTIDLANLCYNYKRLQEEAVGAECAAVLKADAYGVGLGPVASALAPYVKTFFVAHPEEGQRLRAFIPKSRIFVLHGFLPGGTAFMAEHGLIPVINSREQALEWRNFCQESGRNDPVALQFDSGMSRFGLSLKDLEFGVTEGLQPVLVMSHLACADTPDDPANARQRDFFIKMADFFPGVPRSLAASSGIFLGSDYHFDLVRPGAALYGLAPNDQGQNPLRPVVQLEARIVQIRHVEQAAGVGYGMTWRAPAGTRLATVGIGYADGLFRSVSGHMALWYKDIELPVVGRISMDSVSVDIGNISDDALKPGDFLSVIGPHQSVDSVARMAGTIGYEILTSLGHRFERHYVGV